MSNPSPSGVPEPQNPRPSEFTKPLQQSTGAHPNPFGQAAGAQSAPAKSAVKKTAAKQTAAHPACPPANCDVAEAAALKSHAQTGLSTPASLFTEPIVLRDGSPALVRAIRPDEDGVVSLTLSLLNPASAAGTSG